MKPFVEGLGLFSGSPARLSIQPGGTGLRFGVRTPAGTLEIPATLTRRTDTPPHPALAKAGARSTNLAAPGGTTPAVLTTEHVLAACAGCGLWHAAIELEGVEAPIDDGSARAFAQHIAGAEALSRDPVPDPITPREPITISDGDARIELTPAAPGESATYTYHLDYGPGSPVAAQQASWTLGDRGAFIDEIAPARTFSLRAEAEAMRAAGMFTAFEPSQLLVIGDDGLPIDNAWRFENEAARHKLLDLIGDLALLGRPVHAHISASRSGHALNHRLAEAIAARAD